MDTLREPFGDYSEADVYDLAEDEIGHDALPPAIGQDERRLQVRAYNHWASLLGDRPFPLIADMETGSLPDFDPYAVVLDFGEGVENPVIRYIGSALACESEVDVAAIRTLSDVPGRSLLSHITDHYMQILANEAPIGFEAEFINQRGRTILYRGILLPFSGSMGSSGIDLIYGLINWKELADQQTTEALMDEIDLALKVRPARQPQPLTNWADGPADFFVPCKDALGDAGVLDLALLPQPEWVSELIGEDGEDGLADVLASARELAAAAIGAEDRSRHALYAAIGRAHDFALLAEGDPAGLAELLADAGLKQQARAPLVPVVKLVFGAAYDKTRVTEYATALAHARRLGLGAGTLAAVLGEMPGGLKAVVQLERRLKREESEAVALPKESRRAALAGRLRSLPTHPLEQLAGGESEFALVLTRRTATGEIVLIGDLGEDDALFQRAAQRLLG